MGAPPGRAWYRTWVAREPALYEGPSRHLQLLRDHLGHASTPPDKELAATICVALAGAMLPQWSRFTDATAAKDMLAAARAWLARPDEQRRLASARLGRQRTDWRAVIGARRLRRHYGPAQERAEVAELLARDAAKAAGAKSPGPAMKAAVHALSYLLLGQPPDRVAGQHRRRGGGRSARPHDTRRHVSLQRLRPVRRPWQRLRVVWAQPSRGGC